MDAQLKKGLLEFCILCAIEEEPSYGYQIIKDISKYVSIAESTLYTILRRMEEAGYVTSYTKAYNNRLRKYFYISNIGREHLESFRKEIIQVIGILNFINKD